MKAGIRPYGDRDVRPHVSKMQNSRARSAQVSRMHITLPPEPRWDPGNNPIPREKRRVHRHRPGQTANRHIVSCHCPAYKGNAHHGITYHAQFENKHRRQRHNEISIRHDLPDRVTTCVFGRSGWLWNASRPRAGTRSCRRKRGQRRPPERACREAAHSPLPCSGFQA